MKKLFTTIALLCILSVVAQAQYGSFTIRNNTSCDVYILLFGAVNGSGCQTNYSSNVIHIPPVSVVAYSDPQQVSGGLNNGALTLSTADKFTMVRVYHNNPSAPCATTGAADLSDCTLGGAIIVSGFTIQEYTGTGCTNCHTGGSINWIVYGANAAGIDIN